jgi:hypothetical protein
VVVALVEVEAAAVVEAGVAGEDNQLECCYFYKRKRQGEIIFTLPLFNYRFSI